MSISEILATIQGEILDPFIALLFVIATAVFMYGIIRYVIGGGEKDIEAGKKLILYGIIGMTIMVSAWGIVRIFCEFFDTCVLLEDAFGG